MSQDAAHGTYSRYNNRDCRCDLCRAAAKAYWHAQRKKTPYVRSARLRTRDIKHTVTPIQSCDCSLSGIDPPWQWTWDRAASFTPFSEMRLTPTMLDEWDRWPTRDRRFVTERVGYLTRHG